MYNTTQFILWKTIPGNPKPRKVPVHPVTAQICNAHDPGAWVDYETARAYALTTPGHGVGFVFTAADPYFFLDIDNALTGDNWSPLAVDLVNRFPGCFVETSTSGTGLHIIGRYTDLPAHGCKNIPLGLELYTQARFVALTFDNVTGDPETDATAPLHQTAAELFPASTTAVEPLAALTEHPDPEWDGPTDDDDLLSRAMNSRSAAAAFSGKASFSDLWTGNAEVLAANYPDTGESGREYDGSSVDAALCAHLAFWTGKHGSRMARLMDRCVALRRDKWEREDYISRTVNKAIQNCRDVYKQGQTATVPAPPPVEQCDTPTVQQHAGSVTAPRPVNGVRYMHPTQQEQHFRGCVYVTDLNAVMTPSGTVLDQSRFRSVFGGYEFALDPQQTKSTKNAWETFVESRAFDWPKVNTTAFRPDKAPGAIWSEGGQSMVNTYVPVPVPSVPGDASRFLDHLGKLFPDENDRKIILYYMAAVVQHPGVKFQWCPLIQGTEGNGKSLLTYCVAEAVGERYVHMPQAQDLTNKFNSWLDNKIFIGVEDIHVPDHKLEVIETLKPMITARNGIEIHRKGFDQVTRRIVCNFILNSNHKDAIRKHRGDRRFSVFYSAQQSVDDIHNSGMGGDYFPRLYQWLRGGGYAIVTNLLQTIEIPDEYNPAVGCHRAPETSSTGEALSASMGVVEQEIQAAAEEGRQGFAGGWVSSIALDGLLRDVRRHIARNKRTEVLRSLGYVKHPALRDGQTVRRVSIDNGRPRLYIRDGHPDLAIQVPTEVEQAYITAQLDGRLT